MLGGCERQGTCIWNAYIFKILENFGYKSTQAKENENGYSEAKWHIILIFEISYWLAIPREEQRMVFDSIWDQTFLSSFSRSN